MSQGISIIIPTLNEEGSIQELILRIHKTLSPYRIPYEIICVDDHSVDYTQIRVQAMSSTYPVRLYLKQGERGKAQSLLEGFTYAHYDILGFIDADLQYPPESLIDMLKVIHQGYDVVVTKRKVHQESPIRVLMSKIYSLFFTRILHNLPYDVQSGLKIFKRSVLQEMTLKPTQWTFDLGFILQARNNGHSIGSVDIVFHERKNGKSKVDVLRSSWEIAKNSIALRFALRRPQAICAIGDYPTVGAGIAWRRKRFTTHTTLPYQASALRTFVLWQKVILTAIPVALITGLIVNPFLTALLAVGFVSIIYFLDVLFNLYLVRRSLLKPPEISFSKTTIAALRDEELPIYSILCPLYKEAGVLSTFLAGLEKLDWPKDKLDVLLLLEEDDTVMIETLQSLILPPYVRALVLPDSQPKTKPKACNYGLAFATGEYIVVYDAEDIPDPLQLKKAYLGFQSVPSDVRCLQAKLNYFNHNQNLLTRLFTAEYSLWFDVMLTGMQTLNTTIPLGGTSNHFRTDDLRALEGWDPFNVTEDCDLGTRLFRRGYKTAVIDSITLEEANSHIINWIRQRSRWLKGYLQTYLVHMRNPLKFAGENGWHALAFQSIVGGKVLFILLNPFMWFMTIAYFVAYSWVGSSIEALYPAPIFTLAAISLVFGNFLQLLYYMIGSAQRGHWHLLKYTFFLPAYWFLTSIAGYVAAYQLFFKPHYWEKTNHGLHLPEDKRNRWLSLRSAKQTA